MQVIIPSQIPNNFDYRKRAFVREDLLKTSFDQTKENRRPCGPNGLGCQWDILRVQLCKSLFVLFFFISIYIQRVIY